MSKANPSHEAHAEHLRLTRIIHGLANARSTKGGYAFLVAILAIGAITTATVLTMLLLGWAAEQNGLVLQTAQQAFENAQTCGERTLHALRLDPTYGGNETATLARGSYEVLAVTGTGNETRTVCCAGTFRNSVRRMQIQIERLLPATRILSWEEVPAFSLCP